MRYQRLMRGLQVFVLLAACGSSPHPAPAKPSLPRSIRVVDGVVSAYIVPLDASHVALVDCGMDPEAKALLTELTSHGFTADSVQAIFVTHRHADHVGGCERFPNAKLYAFADAEPDPSITTVTDGQVIALGSVELTAFAVPGHTPDSGAYLAAGVLYLGDAAMLDTDGHVIASPRRFHGATHEPDRDKLNLPPLLALHARIAQRTDVVQLAFGHSAPIDDAASLATAR
jgi:glyoxylase-like metal-dependent hydrolase (beta-lactamase superfamily II)